MGVGGGAEAHSPPDRSFNKASSDVQQVQASLETCWDTGPEAGLESAGVARGKSPRLVLWVVGSSPFSSLEQSGFPAIKGGVQHSGLVALPPP